MYLVNGSTVHLANQGVAHTLNTSLNGNSAFVIAYAVASSTTILTPPSPLPEPPPTPLLILDPSALTHPFAESLRRIVHVGTLADVWG